MTIKGLFTEKVDFKDLQRIETKMADFAPWEAVRNVYKELCLYLKKEEFDSHRTEFNMRQHEFGEKLDLMISKNDALMEIGNLKQQIYVDIEKYSKIRDCYNDKVEWQKSFSYLREQVNEFKKTFVKIDNDISTTKKLMGLKADEQELRDMQSTIDEMASKRELSRLEQTVIPKV